MKTKQSEIKYTMDQGMVMVILLSLIGTNGLKGTGLSNNLTSFTLTRSGNTSLPKTPGVTKQGDSSAQTSDTAS